jgi:hypothetical protein
VENNIISATRPLTYLYPDKFKETNNEVWKNNHPITSLFPASQVKANYKTVANGSGKGLLGNSGGNSGDSILNYV